MPYKNPEIRKAFQRRYQKEWRQRNKDRVKQYKRDDYAREDGKPEGNITCYHKRRLNHQQLRLECINYYSNGENCCDCCGEKHLEFLAIDHINGGGSAHRKEVRKRYPSMYHFLKAQNFPIGYRVLCHNCNLSLGFYGYCPHNAKTEGGK